MKTPQSNPAYQDARSEFRPRPHFVDLSPRLAADRLGFPSVEALWAFLRRNAGPASRVDFGGDVFAYRRGKRSWIVRFPDP